MSIDMHLESSNTQRTTTKTAANELVESYQQLSRAIASFVNCSELESVSYSSAKTYFQEVISVLVDGGKMLTVSVEEAVRRFPEQYIAQVCDYSLKESELLSQIHDLSTRISEGKRLLDETRKEGILKSTLPQIELLALEASKQSLEKLLEDLRNFNATSPSLFSDISNLQTALATGLTITRTAFNPESKSFILPEDMSWVQEVKDIIAQRDILLFAWEMDKEYGWDREKAERWYQLRSEYGFSSEEIYLMAKFRDGIDEELPELSTEERDYIWLRLLGGATYDEDGDPVVQTMFAVTSGYLKDAKSGYRFFGLSDEEASRLHYGLRLQHQFVGKGVSSTDLKEDQPENYGKFKAQAVERYGSMTDAEFNEFWDSRMARYQEGSDFTHFAINLATERYRGSSEGILKGGFVPDPADIYGFLRGTDATSLSGWVGDTTKKGGNTVSIVDDDYRADLDAVNISRRIDETGLSYSEAQQQYYSDLESGKTNRADEFESNVGIEEIKKQLFSLVPLFSEKEPYIILTESQKIEYLKNNYPMSYNFLLSVQNHQNSYTDYASQEHEE